MHSELNWTIVSINYAAVEDKEAAEGKELHLLEPREE
jgi:hypothetical protein